MSSIRMVAVLALVVVAGSTRDAAGAAAPNPQPAPAGQAKRVDARAFRALAEQKGGTYLDVRTPAEVARGHLPNASVIDIHDPKFTQKLALMQKDRPVFVYCASGGRSAKAAEAMVQMGFAEVYDLEGGIGSWTREGYPTERSETAAAEPASALDPKALDALLKANQRVLVDYHTPWCAPCRKMTPIVDAIAEAWKGRAIVLRVDIGESEALAAREKIQGVPVFVLYVAGRERWRASGEMPRETLEAQLAKP